MDGNLQRKVRAELRAVAAGPGNPANWTTLRGRGDDLRRIRVGNYRVLFYLRDEIRVLNVHRIGPRGDVYKDL